MKTIYKNIFMIIGLVLILASCDKEDPTSFKAEPAINFATDSLAYSFLGNNTGEFIVEIPVHIIGDSVNYDRNFSVEILDDEISNASPSTFEILDAKIPANSFSGILRIKVFNNDDIGENGASLHLKIENSEDFKIGNEEANTFILRWTNKVVVPAWTYFRYFFTRYASTKAYLIFVEVTGMTNFTLSDYLAIGPTGAQALGKAYGDYIREYNSEHPDSPILHDDGDHAGEEIIPIY